MSQSNDSGLNLDHLEALMQYCGVTVRDTSYGIDIKAMNGNSIYLTNDLLLELARRAALANQPAPTVSADAMSQFAAWKGYELPPLNSDGNFDKDWLHREWRAFQAGMARAAHQPAQEQADPRMLALEAANKQVEIAKSNRVARSERLGISAQQEPVAAPCVICGSDEPRTGTCGSDDPRALCKQPVAAPQQTEAPKPPFPISDDEMAALRRFWECATDGEGYDVEKAMMQRLAEMGLVQRKSGAYYMATEFGLYVLGEYTVERAAQLDDGQEGSAT